MIKRILLLLHMALVFIPVRALGSEHPGRSRFVLSDDNWFLWRDAEAQWKNDILYLLSEVTSLSSLPVNPPTGGWGILNERYAVRVSVPGTVEEYLTVSDHPRPEHLVGVSWWFREMELPAELDGRLFILDFESVRMREAHAIDPSRIMTFTSGWAGNEQSEEDSKAHILPFDTTLYRKGWFDNHRAGGPETWLEEYYKSPEDNLMFANNRTEVYLRGEEGALSTPPRIQKIYDEVTGTGKYGWDGLFWRQQYDAFAAMFKNKNLAPYFGTIDLLTRKMGNISLEHQGRRIQGMRMQDIGDGYMVNGWEAMPYDNHSGIVDIYRNPKGDLSAFTYYTQLLYLAVSPRSQVIRSPGEVVVDFYAVNEKDLKGHFTLQINLVDPQVIIDRVKEDGTTLIVLDAVESWMDVIGKNTEIRYDGYYAVGRNWVGGVHFVKEHPLFRGLPVNDGMNWPYQAVVHKGDRRLGLRIHGEEMIVGAYKSTPFELGTAVGVIPCGKGKILFSTLDIADNLDQPSGPPDRRTENLNQ